MYDFIFASKKLHQDIKHDVHYTGVWHHLPTLQEGDFSWNIFNRFLYKKKSMIAKGSRFSSNKSESGYMKDNGLGLRKCLVCPIALAPIV